MTLRAVLAVAWSLFLGMGGGWLILIRSHWAVGQQPSSGDWTVVTNAQVRTGIGLLVLAIIGLVLAIAEGVSVLREAGVLVRGVPAAEPGEARSVARDRPAASTDDLDRALISLASTLA